MHAKQRFGIFIFIYKSQWRCWFFPSFPAHTSYPWRGVQNTCFSALPAMSGCTCNWIVVSGLSYLSVAPFPSKGSAIVFYSISYSSSLYMPSACHWDRKKVRCRVRDWSSTKPTQRQWQPRRQQPLCLHLLLRASATGFRHVGNKEKVHYYVLTQLQGIDEGITAPAVTQSSLNSA